MHTVGRRNARDAHLTTASAVPGRLTCCTGRTYVPQIQQHVLLDLHVSAACCFFLAPDLSAFKIKIADGTAAINVV